MDDDIISFSAGAAYNWFSFGLYLTFSLAVVRKTWILQLFGFLIYKK